MLQQLQVSVPVTPELRAGRNALASNSVQSLVINPEVENRTDKFFTHVIKRPGSIADQQKSGRAGSLPG